MLQSSVFLTFGTEVYMIYIVYMIIRMIIRTVFIFDILFTVLTNACSLIVYSLFDIFLLIVHK